MKGPYFDLPLRMRISSEFLLSSKTSTTQSPASCVESAWSPLTICSLQFRNDCEFAPVLALICWSMRILWRNENKLSKKTSLIHVRFTDTQVTFFILCRAVFHTSKIIAGSCLKAESRLSLVACDAYLRVIIGVAGACSLKHLYDFHRNNTNFLAPH